MHVMHQRRLDERQHDEDVHGTVGGKPGSANLFRNPHAPVDFHGAGIAALHLGKELRRLLLLDDRAAHPAAAEIDGERQACGSRADDENLRVHSWTLVNL
jgi:hypothetical protein